MALRALGRSRVITATPLGKIRPLTKSSAVPAMAARQRHEMEGRKRSKKWELGVEKRVEGRRGREEGFSRKWKRESGARIVVCSLWKAPSREGSRHKPLLRPRGSRTDEERGHLGDVKLWWTVITWCGEWDFLHHLEQHSFSNDGLGPTTCKCRWSTATLSWCTARRYATDYRDFARGPLSSVAHARGEGSGLDGSLLTRKSFERENDQKLDKFLKNLFFHIIFFYSLSFIFYIILGLFPIVSIASVTSLYQVCIYYAYLIALYYRLSLSQIRVGCLCHHNQAFITVLIAFALL